MSYKGEFLTELKLIIELISNDDLDGDSGAYIKFDNYLNAIISIGEYKSNTWIKPFTKEFYKFGRLFKDKNPVEFLKRIDKKNNESSNKEKEILGFIKSEILLNHELDKVKTLKYLKKLNVDYPYNPEFIQTLAVLYRAAKQYDEALNCHKMLVKTSSSNSDFVDGLFNFEVNYISDMISNHEYVKAQKVIDEMTKSERYEKIILYKNHLYTLKERLNDHINIDIKIKSSIEEIDKVLAGKFEKERKRTIELLGMFTALMAFILTNINIVVKFPFKQAFALSLVQGLILILFLVGISCISSPSSKNQLDIRPTIAGIIFIILVTCMHFLFVINL